MRNRLLQRHWLLWLQALLRRAQARGTAGAPAGANSRRNHQDDAVDRYPLRSICSRIVKTFADSSLVGFLRGRTPRCVRCVPSGDFDATVELACAGNGEGKIAFQIASRQIAVCAAMTALINSGILYLERFIEESNLLPSDLARLLNYIRALDERMQGMFVCVFHLCCMLLSTARHCPDPHILSSKSLVLVAHSICETSCENT
jgi:hypothetical protein